MVWATESNADKLLDSFDGGVDADTASLGSFKEDFAKFVENYDIGEVCPFVSSSSALKTEDSDAIIESVKIMNCKIDRASWRAALLACTTIGTKVEELCCVGLELSEVKARTFYFPSTSCIFISIILGNTVEPNYLHPLLFLSLLSRRVMWKI
jgi:hypothetical protein